MLQEERRWRRFDNLQSSTGNLHEGRINPPYIIRRSNKLDLNPIPARRPAQRRGGSTPQQGADYWIDGRTWTHPHIDLRFFRDHRNIHTSGGNLGDGVGVGCWAIQQQTM